MGLHIHPGTMPGGVTPICNTCGVALCWDIGADEAEEQAEFWDAWICRHCNGGKAMSLESWKADALRRKGGSDGN